MKAALQALIGVTFTGIFESLVLGTKAGVPGKVLFDVFTSSGVRSPLLENCAKLIMDREFKDTGSHIGTMYKDLGISMDLAKQNGAAMFTAAAAHELFQSGISLFPDEDNWSLVKLLSKSPARKSPGNPSDAEARNWLALIGILFREPRVQRIRTDTERTWPDLV